MLLCLFGLLCCVVCFFVFFCVWYRRGQSKKKQGNKSQLGWVRLSELIPASVRVRATAWIMRVYCPIHGTIDLGPVASHVACTASLLRLDAVRQLGGCSYVYPSATHTRRAHSIGVAHLSRIAGERLRVFRPDLVRPQDVDRLELAGLVHDLGHGPFSHLFEVCFPDFCHEREGLRQLSDLASSDDEFLTLAKSHLGEGWMEAVRAMILGDDAFEPERAFLYQIVHAHDSGVDTDKLDYLSRDCHMVLGVSNAIASMRIIHGMRIVTDSARRSIVAFDERVASDVFRVYSLRASLHRQVYQHRSTLLIESLLCDMLRRVDASRVARGEESLQHMLSTRGVGTLVDATITLDPAAHIERVTGWKRWRRVDATVHIRTSPHCRACGAATLIADRFCKSCGESLKDRPSMSIPTGEGKEDEVRHVVDDEIRAQEATQQMQTASGHAVRVTISDVHGGAHCVRQDAFGVKWHDWSWDVIPIVRDGQAAKDVAQNHQPRGTMRWREAACYAPPGTTDDEMETIKDVFLKWGRPLIDTASQGRLINGSDDDVAG